MNCGRLAVGRGIGCLRQRLHRGGLLAGIGAPRYRAQQQVRRRDVSGLLLQRDAQRCLRVGHSIHALVHEPAQKLHVTDIRIDTNSRVELFECGIQTPAFQVDGAKRRAHAGSNGSRSPTNFGSQAGLDSCDGAVPQGQTAGHGIDGRCHAQGLRRRSCHSRH